MAVSGDKGALPRLTGQQGLASAPHGHVWLSASAGTGKTHKPKKKQTTNQAAQNKHPNDMIVARARTLFAKVLDAPGGGIRIQTIHGFCQSLLSAFPVEAGLVPGFRPIEAREEAVMAREALAELLLDADREGRARPVEAIGALSVRLGEQGAENFLFGCARAPEAMAALPLGEGIQPF